MIPGSTRLSSVAIACLMPSCTAAQDVQYGIEWATIGDPGNRHANENEAPRFYPPFSGNAPIEVGRVDYEYRMAVTEVTVSQWHEFVVAYAAVCDCPKRSPQFTSLNIRYDDGEFVINPGTEQQPVQVSWRYAARFANWLHNDKALHAGAFETGAYDTSTFGENSDGTLTDQRRRSDDAAFWIPDLDEWTKAMHWDPEKDGVGGYWRYALSSDDAPIVASPEDGGETNAGMSVAFDVASYPESLSPWGLLDGSGGEAEWLETVISELDRGVRGSSLNLGPDPFGRLDTLSSSSPRFGLDGIRLAALVPSPGSFVVITAVALIRRTKRGVQCPRPQYHSSAVHPSP